uniref:Uncharacterized protein n=1 Tax=Ditylenchus dipsaci TaxID=166011 RepID=A0A915CTI9_9BILA
MPLWGIRCNRWRSLSCKRKNCPRITTFEEFMTEENRAMLLRCEEQKQVIGILAKISFSTVATSSPPQLQPHHQRCTFKYAPKGVMQNIQDLRFGSSTPCNSCGDRADEAEKMLICTNEWGKVPVRESLLEINVVNSISFANFDAEIALFNICRGFPRSFRETLLFSR